MRIALSIVLCLFTAYLAACSSTNKSTERMPAAAFYVDPTFYDFQTLMYEALNFRAQALRFAEEKKLGQSRHVTLTRSEGEFVRAMGGRYLEIRQKLVKMSADEGQAFALQNQVVLAPHQGTRSEQSQAAPGPESFDVYTQLNIDPTDAAGEKAIFRIQMALASALILVDNYLVAIQPFNEDPTLSYVLNYDVPQKKALQLIADSYSSPDRRSQIQKAIKFVDEVMAWRRKNNLSTSPEEAHLYTMIQSSVWYLSVKNHKTSNPFVDAIANLWNRLTLQGKRSTRAASHLVSMGFGNMVGMVATRRGHLDTMPASEKAQLIAEMKPLDILLEKTPFRLTDKMIPGHYGHVAIWMGTEKQLKDLQVWNQIPASIQARIRAGHHVVEALRPGVQINTLDHFLNIDDFLVLRDNRTLTDEYRRKAVLQAIAQIGKEYDFNFDVHTHERIVCSEIAYVVFADVKWPLEEKVRRYTISPDNVAQLALGKSAIYEPVIMYYGGKRVYQNLPYSLGLLLRADSASYAQFEKLQNL